MIDSYEHILYEIDKQIPFIQSRELPQLLSTIPLDLFGQLLLDVPSKFPNIKAFFPSMASDAIQDSWTGAHGITLLAQSVAFVKTLIAEYTTMTGKDLGNAIVLDYGCGWGRLIRLLYKHVPIENIYAVDPWDQSIELCKRHGIKANLALSAYVPTSLPFEHPFDLIYAFSVFTHLSEKTTHIVLNTLRKRIVDTGVLILTIRPKEYWYIHKNGAFVSDMLKAHDEKGFAFIPHNRPPINGDITYGDTSISLDYFSRHFPQWKLTSVKCNSIDQYQVILFLQPV